MIGLEFREIAFSDPYYRAITIDDPFVDVPCPVCERDDMLFIVSKAEGSAATALCTRCEHFFFRRRPPPEWFARFYRTEWIRGGTHGKSRGRAAIKERARRLLGQVGVMRLRAASDPEQHFLFCTPWFRRGIRVLEVGAGSGRYLQPFVDAGAVCSAIEPSENSAAACRARGIEVVAADVETALSAVSDKFDLIITNHSLEHHYDPNALMRLAERALTSDGALCISVPNHHRLFLLTEKMFVLHLQSFTEHSLERLFAKYGFSVERKLVDQQLRFIARRGEAGIPTGAVRTPAELSELYLARFSRTFQISREASGSFGIGFRRVTNPVNPLWGEYDVRVAPHASLQGTLADFPMKVLLDVRSEPGDDAVFSLHAQGAKHVPLFVK